MLTGLESLPGKPVQLSRPLRYILFMAFLIALLLAYYYPFLFAGRVYVSSDHHLFFEPFCRFIGDAYRHGRLPLWNQYLYFGMPQFALPSPSFLYPPSLLYAIQTYSQGLSTQQIIHHVVAAIGGALLAESLGLGFAAAACAGMSFAFSGYMFSLSANYSLVAAVSWMPLALFVSRRIRFAANRAQRCFWTMMLSIFVFLMISAGRPEAFVPVLVIVTAHAITGIGRHYIFKYKRNWLRKADFENPDPADKLDTHHPLKVFLCRIAALTIGGCLCMPLLLPALEWAATSTRAKGLVTSEVMMWSANWYSFTTMFLGQPFGDLQLLGNGFLPFAADRASYLPFLPSAYVGAGVLTLALLGIFHTRSPWLVPAALLLTVGTTFSLGRYTPVLPWLVEHVSALSVMRYPVKLLVLPIMALCLLAAFGIQAAKDNLVGYRALRGMAIAWLVVMFAGLACVFFGRYWLTMQSVRLSINSEISIALGTAIFHAGSIGLTMSVICILRHKNMLGGLAFAVFTFALLAMDLFGTAIRFSPLSAPATFITDKPALLSMLEKQVGEKNIGSCRVMNLYYDPLATPNRIFDGPPAVRTLNYYRYCRDLLVCNCNMDYGVHEAYGYEGTLSAKYRRLTLGLINDFRNAKAAGPVQKSDKAFGGSVYNERMRRFLAATGVQYVACQIHKDGEEQPALDPGDFDVVEEATNFNLRLYKAKRPKPRFELVDRWTWVDSQDKAYRILQAEELKARGVSMMPLIERLEKEKKDYPRGFLSPDHKYAPTCQLLKDEPEHITISVSVPHPCMLILRDRFYPGWKALLDSVSVPIYRANGLTRAIYVPEGAHAIEFNYKPDSFRYGVRVALLALAALAMLASMTFGPSAWRFVRWTAGKK
ncbi:MAG: hypothetical protein IT342_05985 [Candidatus Melainabacteria bacterium]|nr:hypothetical protein [Candidatus Melainabacteria bacterium]